MPVTISKKQEVLIGQGIQSPVQFSENGGTELFVLSNGLNRINQSIKTILDTPVGSRFNNVYFGSNLHKRVFEPNDYVLKDLLYYDIYGALQRWEARIVIKDVEFITWEEDNSVSEHQINILITYLVTSTQQIGSYVYPFVRNGAAYSSIDTPTGI